MLNNKMSRSLWNLKLFNEVSKNPVQTYNLLFLFQKLIDIIYPTQSKPSKYAVMEIFNTLKPFMSEYGKLMLYITLIGVGGAAIGKTLSDQSIQKKLRQKIKKLQEAKSELENFMTKHEESKILQEQLLYEQSQDTSERLETQKKQLEKLQQEKEEELKQQIQKLQQEKLELEQAAEEAKAAEDAKAATEEEQALMKAAPQEEFEGQAQMPSTPVRATPTREEIEKQIEKKSKRQGIFKKVKDMLTLTTVQGLESLYLNVIENCPESQVNSITIRFIRLMVKKASQIPEFREFIIKKYEDIDNNINQINKCQQQFHEMVFAELPKWVEKAHSPKVYPGFNTVMEQQYTEEEEKKETPTRSYKFKPKSAASKPFPEKLNEQLAPRNNNNNNNNNNPVDVPEDVPEAPPMGSGATKYFGTTKTNEEVRTQRWKVLMQKLEGKDSKSEAIDPQEKQEIQKVNRDMEQVLFSTTQHWINRLLNDSAMEAFSKENKSYPYIILWKNIYASNKVELEQSMIHFLTRTHQRITDDEKLDQFVVNIWHNILKDVYFGDEDIFRDVLYWMFTVNDNNTWEAYVNYLKHSGNEDSNGNKFHSLSMLLEYVQNLLTNTPSLFLVKYFDHFRAVVELLNQNVPQTIQKQLRHIMGDLTQLVFTHDEKTQDTQTKIEKIKYETVVPFIVNYAAPKVINSIVKIDLDSFDPNTFPLFVYTSEKWALSLEDISKLYEDTKKTQKIVSRQIGNEDENFLDVKTIINEIIDTAVTLKIKTIQDQLKKLHKPSLSNKKEEELRETFRQQLKNNVREKYASIEEKYQEMVTNINTSDQKYDDKITEKKAELEEKLNKKNAELKIQNDRKIDGEKKELETLLNSEIDKEAEQQANAEIKEQINKEYKEKEKELDDDLKKQIENSQEYKETIQKATEKHMKHDQVNFDKLTQQEDKSLKLTSQLKTNLQEFVNTTIGNLPPVRQKQWQGILQTFDAAFDEQPKPIKTKRSITERVAISTLRDEISKKLGGSLKEWTENHSKIFDAWKAFKIQEDENQKTIEDIKKKIQEIDEKRKEFIKRDTDKILQTIFTTQKEEQKSKYDEAYQQITQKNMQRLQELTQEKKDELKQQIPEKLEQYQKKADQTKKFLKENIRQIRDEIFTYEKTEKAEKETQKRNIISDFKTYLTTFVNRLVDNPIQIETKNIQETYDLAIRVATKLVEGYGSSDNLVDRENKRLVDTIRNTLFILYRKTMSPLIQNLGVGVGLSVRRVKKD